VAQNIDPIRSESYTECTLNAWTNFIHEFPIPKERKRFITMYVRKEFSRYSPTFARPQCFEFLSVGTLKTLEQSVPTENKVTLHQSVFMPVKPSKTSLDLSKGATLHDQKFPRAYFYRRRTFWAFDVSCDLIENNNSAFIKLKMFIVNVLYQL